jgi:DNA-binding transcriptional regulator YdaS (Cro superfamily)
MDELTKNQLISHFGNQVKIATFVGKTPATVSQWLTNKHFIPIICAKRLANETGISFYSLRPDVPHG